jgi:large subunit ribosomal protein L21
MYAIVRLDGCQYLVSEGEKVKVALRPEAPDSVLKMEDVLLLKSDKDVVIGTPQVAGAVVEAKVVRHFKNPKVMIGKFIRRENYRRKKGHKQPMTEIEITRIGRAG